MKIYKEVLIETTEQAEAMPEGTVAICAEDWPVEKSGGLWGSQGYPSSFLADTGDWTALVPIKVKEVNVVAQGILEYDMNGRVVLEQANQPSARDYKRTEFHTAWRPA